MSLIHLHLLLNHLPTVGIPLAALSSYGDREASACLSARPWACWSS